MIKLFLQLQFDYQQHPSGQERTVVEGLDLIKELVDIAGDRTVVMPGGGIVVTLIASPLLFTDQI